MVEVSPYDEIRSVIEHIELPLDLGSGMTIISIDLLEDLECIRYIVAVNENEIDMDLLKQYAKINMLNTIETEDIKSQELQFCLYCMNHNISLKYIYQSNSDMAKKITVSLTSEDLKNAFQKKNNETN